MIGYFLKFITLAVGSTISYYSALETLCSDCTVDAWDMARGRSVIKSYQNPNNYPANKEYVLAVQKTKASFVKAGEESLTNNLNSLILTPYGHQLAEKVIDGNVSKVGVILFFEVPLVNGRADFSQPMWVTERNSIHNLFGLFTSDGEVGYIALNNYQHKWYAKYTFAHELFHLLDGNHSTDSNIIDAFLSEYRAILAELKFYQEYIAYKKKNKELYVNSKWHDELIGFWGTINADRVFQVTLDLLYPLAPKNVAIDKDTLQLFHEAIITGDLYKVGYTEDKSILALKRNENAISRKIIQDYFKSNSNKGLLDIRYINILREKGLNTFTSPRPRGPGG